MLTRYLLPRPPYSYAKSSSSSSRLVSLAFAATEVALGLSWDGLTGKQTRTDVDGAGAGAAGGDGLVVAPERRQSEEE